MNVLIKISNLRKKFLELKKKNNNKHSVHSVRENLEIKLLRENVTQQRHSRALGTVSFDAIIENKHVMAITASNYYILITIATYMISRLDYYPNETLIN